MRYVVYALFAVVSVFVQALVQPWVGTFFTGADAMLAMVVALAAFAGPYGGAIYGASLGLICDALFSTSGLGQFAIMYALVGAASGYLFKQTYRRLPLVILLGASAGALRIFWQWLPQYVGGVRLNLFAYLWRIALPQVLLTAALCILFYAALYQAQKLRFMTRRSKLDEL